MNSKSFYLIGALAVVAAAGAWWVAQQRAPQTSVGGDGALVANLESRVNDVDKIVVTTAGGVERVTLQRSDDAWRVAQRGGYRADVAKIRKLLIDIGDTMLVERKSARSENYPALGVQPVTDADASGVQIALGGLGQPTEFVIGKTTRGSAGVYVRRSGEDVSWVANKRLSVGQNPADWLVNDLIDVNASRVVQVTITQPDGAVLEAVRNGANFEVADLPEGKTLSSPDAANELAEVFNNLKFDDVTLADEFDAGDAKPVVIRYVTSDGLVVNATATAANNEYYLALTTTVATIDPEKFTDVSDENAPTPAEKAAAMLDAMTNQSREINERVTGWVFTIPLFKYEQLSMTKDSLLIDAG